MTGKELYELYVDKLLKEGVGVDAWDELEDHDRRAWDEMAVDIEAFYA